MMSALFILNQLRALTLVLTVTASAVFSSTSAAGPRPSVLIDYALLPTHSRVRLPRVGPSAETSAATENLVNWVLITDVDSVRVGLAETGESPRPGEGRRFEFADFGTFRAAAGASGEVLPSVESLGMLRARVRELGLVSARDGADAPASVRDERLRKDPRVTGVLPEHAVRERVRAKFIERLREGGLRLHLGGVVRHPDDVESNETFAATVDFADFEDFNRASGEAITGADFWRPRLSFWRVVGRPGLFVMKTRTEAAADCARDLGTSW